MQECQGLFFPCTPLRRSGEATPLRAATCRLPGVGWQRVCATGFWVPYGAM